jgi:hypothetical protein
VVIVEEAVRDLFVLAMIFITCWAILDVVDSIINRRK